MPTFDYRCADCGEVKELPRPIAERDYPALCACGGDMQRQPAAPGFGIRGWKTPKSGRGRTE